jgi:hypothetical protein
MLKKKWLLIAATGLILNFLLFGFGITLVREAAMLS